jgi:hypothetical protein
MSFLYGDTCHPPRPFAYHLRQMPPTKRICLPFTFVLKLVILEYMNTLPVIRFKPICQLTYKARLVYSYLAFRARVERGATLRRISRQLKIDRGTTLKPAINQLRQQDLVIRKGRQWYAKPLPPDLYFQRRNSKWASHWTKSYAYYKVSLPEKVVTTLQALLLGVVSAFTNKKGTTSYGYLAKCLNITTRQARYNIARLKSLKLVDVQELGFGSLRIKPQPITETTAGYFRDKSVPVAKVAAPVIVEHNYKPDSPQAKDFAYYTGRGVLASRVHQLIAWMSEDDVKVELFAERAEERTDFAHKEMVAAKKIENTPLKWGLLFWVELLKSISEWKSWSEPEYKKWKKFT